MKRILGIVCSFLFVALTPINVFADDINSNISVEVSFYNKDNIQIDRVVFTFTQTRRNNEYIIKDNNYYFVIDEIIFSEEPEVIITRGDEVINIGEKYSINSQPIYFNEVNILNFKVIEYSSENELMVSYVSKSDKAIIDSNTFDARKYERYILKYPSTAKSIELIVACNDLVTGVSLDGVPGVEADFGYTFEIDCANDNTYRLVINYGSGQCTTDIELQRDELSDEKDLKTLKIDCFDDINSLVESKTIDNISDKEILVRADIRTVMVSAECSKYAQWETDKKNNIASIPDDIKVTVTAEDGSQKDYDFSIKNAEDVISGAEGSEDSKETATGGFNTFSNLLVLILIFVFVAVLITVLIVIIRCKKLTK